MISICYYCLNAIRANKTVILICFILTAVFGIPIPPIQKNIIAADLTEIKQNQVIRHLGISYANFITGKGDGLDVELIQLFAERLGVNYKFVSTSWNHAISDLSGKSIVMTGGNVKTTNFVEIKGDILASGMTILPWRQKLIDYSVPTFPTQIWLLARADSPIAPIRPTGNLKKDIQKVKRLLKGRSVLGKVGTCVDPSLYEIRSLYFPKSSLFMAPSSETAFK